MLLYDAQLEEGRWAQQEQEQAELERQPHRQVRTRVVQETSELVIDTGRDRRQQPTEIVLEWAGGMEEGRRSRKLPVEDREGITRESVEYSRCETG